MAEESKTYVFGNDQNSLLPALMGNGGFGGGNAWWVVILLALLWGRNGFGGGDAAPILGALNGDTGRELLAQGIQGNASAISQLASTFNTTAQNMAGALNTLNTGILSVGNQVGLSGQQVINAIQTGNMSLQQQLMQCCCDNKLLVTQLGYEDRIAMAQQTTVLGDKIDAQTALINDKFGQLEIRALQDKIESLRDVNTNLRGTIDNANQTAAIQSYVASVVTPVAHDVAALKAAAPPTVPVVYPQLSAIPTSALYGYGPYAGGGSIWS